MGLRDLLKKKGPGRRPRLRRSRDPGQARRPEFTFIRSDTNTHEIIHPPSAPRDQNAFLSTKDAAGSSSSSSRARRSLDVFRPRSRGSSTSSEGKEHRSVSGGGGGHRRLSQRLHLSKPPPTSDFVPENLPQINVSSAEEGALGRGAGGVGGGGGGGVAVVVDKDAYEGQWEKRATILAEANERGQRRSRSPSVASHKTPSSSSPPSYRFYDEVDGSGSGGGGGGNGGYGNGGGQGQGQIKTTPPVVSSKEIDDMIQEAIRLHEEGELDQSTRLFGRLADPQGANNPLSQVLYGLALRHGWGCEPDPERAVTYLSAAASNAAAVESMALQAGLKKGGAAKGELVLAIFELANCFRHGWGIPRDPVAAKQYYETAANLGDTDAMNEVAWCYLEGFGCKKDKYAAARYYRLAEENGNKTLGNTWIWKDKYNPTNPKKK
ncbi:HCP-like protein [Hypoxylon sp. EC38]|nr:HCP-like protein [Hypoxylon sp. EC38]